MSSESCRAGVFVTLGLVLCDKASNPVYYLQITFLDCTCWCLSSCHLL